MHTFPKPLTPGEERSCLERMKEGDHEARNTLIERNLRLVEHVTRKYQGTDYEMEDLLSIGTIGLIKAVNTFHPERGSRLATYAAKCIENEILMTFRAGKKYAKDISLYDPIGVDKDGETVSRMDVLEAEGKEVLETIILKQEIERCKALECGGDLRNTNKEQKKQLADVRVDICQPLLLSFSPQSPDIRSGSSTAISRSQRTSPQCRTELPSRVHFSLW